ncbi:MAG: hypothetical protein ACOYLS_06440 [Polymorphobacter sp.]
MFAVGAGAVALLALPVIGQQSATEPQVPASETDAPPPKSLLPDSFDGPAIAPNTAPDPLLPPTDAGAMLPGQPPLLDGQTAPLQPVDPFAAPLATGRDISVFGPLRPETGGYGTATFSGSRGAFLASLTRRITAPIGSRWAMVTLRRALLSESAAPAGIVPGDWVAARAWLLVRMGEVDGAKALVDAVPVDRYSPALYRVAAQVALAAADIGGLCPIAVTGRSLSNDPLWQLAVGMCAALQGDDITAAGIFDALRDEDKAVEPFDVRLGERVATIAGGAGRATNIDWAESPALTPYRYGIATAAGVAIPAGKLAALGPARFGWLVRSPGVAPDIRLAALRPATVLGTMSATELVSGIAALSPGDAAADTPAGRLRTAFAGASLSDRLQAMRAIWASGGADDRYGGLLESATAAARLPVTAKADDDSANIIAALLAAGSADAARRWWPVADKAGGKVRAEAWALLATGSGGVPTTAAEFKDWRSVSGADDRRAGLLLAALAGLGSTRDGEWSRLKGDLLPRAANSWTRAIDAAAAGGRTGEVTILAATGLQGPWTEVPPLHLYHIVAALTRVGRAPEARLIAAEALTRA